MPASRVPPPVLQPRPPAAAGIFETVLAVDGRPVELEAHARRLEASAHQLYGARPDGVRDAIVGALAGAAGRLARVRIDVRPGAQGLRLGVGVGRVRAVSLLPAEPVGLEPLTVPGGASLV